MKWHYQVEDQAELQVYQSFAKACSKKLPDYLLYLKETYAVEDLPTYIVLANQVAACQLIRESPLPAYTNDFRIVMTPDLEVWRSLYLKQVEGLERLGVSQETVAMVGQHYQQNLSDRYLYQILGHELCHHSDLFGSDFTDYGPSDMWFEEGMVEYISRQYFLTPEECQAEKTVNQAIVEVLIPHWGASLLEEFSLESYQEDLLAIFYHYWRSYLTIEHLVAQYGSVSAVFAAYHEWLEKGQDQTLSQYLGV